MAGVKEATVLEAIIEDNSEPFHIQSCEQVGNMCRNVELFYSDSFVKFARAQKNSRFKREVLKMHNCAVTYGYRGYSARKNNGIVDIKPTDAQLAKDVNRLLTPEVVKSYDLSDDLKPVKVVAHVPNGNRLVGVLDNTPAENRHKVVILGVSNYNGRPR
ncbi:hypothetical protein GF343_02590 [Candidatus Woesearchaeota archaeon]|nr:hypothetical protein [Candidatus Woesearchaeota archaeon]